MTAPLDAWAKARLVYEYSEAKNRRDVAGALRVCHEAFTIDTPAFGVVSCGKGVAEANLHVFFAAFPDYAASAEGEAESKDGYAQWGTVRLTFAGELAGLPATHRTAEVAFTSIYTFADGSLASERFFFSLGALCEQLGVEMPAMWAALAPFRETACAPAA